MIYVVGTGGGGLPTSKAVLHVSAPAGSTVKVKKSSDSSWKDITNTGHVRNSNTSYGDWYYAVETGASWAAQISKSGQPTVTSSNVSVSYARQYDFILDFDLVVWTYSDNGYSAFSSGTKRDHIGIQDAGNGVNCYAQDYAWGPTMWWNTAIDVSSYNSLEIIAGSLSGAKEYKFGLAADNTTVGASSTAFLVSKTLVSGTNTLSISSYSGSRYIKIACPNPDYTDEFVITSIKLKK